MADVVDRDLGEQAILRRLIDADGMNVRAGVLSAVPRYPKGGGKTKGQQVAKVAAVHGLVKSFGNVFDREKSNLNAAIERAHARIIAGDSAEVALVRVGKLLRNEMREEVEKAGLVDTGRLRETVRSAVFDGASRVAGDVHNRPRASDPV